AVDRSRSQPCLPAGESLAGERDRTFQERALFPLRLPVVLTPEGRLDEAPPGVDTPVPVPCADPLEVLGPDACPKRRVLDQRAELSLERTGRTVVYDESALQRPKGLFHDADPRGDDGQSARHRLEHGIRRPFVRRRAGEY